MSIEPKEGNNKPLEWQTVSNESPVTTLQKNVRKRAGNLLEPKTPEEYIANCEIEIENVEGRIEQNKKSIQEAESQLPDYKEKAQREKEIVESFSVEKLSKFLSVEELEIIKKGRKYSELDEIIAKGMVDPLEDLIKKIFEGIKDLTDEERLIIAKYLGSKQIIYVGMRQHECEFFGFDCIVGFYYTDFPDEMDRVTEVENNLSRLGFRPFVVYTGDSCYSLDDSLYEKAERIIKEDLFSDSENEIKLELSGLDKKGTKLAQKLESLKNRKCAVKKYGLPVKEAISLYKWSKDLYRVQDEFYDKKNHILVVLHEYSDYIPGCGGNECGSVISIKRGKSTTKKSFKYRDRYDPNNDNPRNEYRKIKTVKVDGDKVEVTVVSRVKSTDTYTFDIAYKEPKIPDKSKKTESVKKSVNEEVFTKIVEQKKQELIDRYTKDLKYPIVCDKENNTLVRSTIELGGNYVPYDKPEVVYEKINLRSGKACIVIKAQIDTDFEAGKQFCIVKCVINSKGETIDREEYNYWQYQIIEDPEGVNKKINSLKRIG